MANTQKKSEGSPSTLFSEDASKPVSRVLSFKTAIYLDAPLPVRSSRLPGTVGPTCVSLHGVAPDRVYSDGRLARRRVSSYLTFPPLPHRRKFHIPRFPQGKARSFHRASSPAHGGSRRYISVALFLGSPPAGVTRYPCPAEPGLSSCAAFRRCARDCPTRSRKYCTLFAGKSQMDCNFFPARI